MEEYLIKETIEAMKIHLDEYLNTVWKTFAALMLSIGWLITSEDAREVILKDIFIQRTATILVIFMAISHLATLIDLYKKSAKAKKSLGTNLEGLLLSVVNTYSIPKVYPLASFIINGLLYLFLIGILLFGVKHGG